MGFSVHLNVQFKFYNLPIILFFKGKDPNFFQSVVVFIIGNIWLIGYFISGNNKRKKKIEKEMNIMKAKDISRKK